MNTPLQTLPPSPQSQMSPLAPMSTPQPQGMSSLPMTQPSQQPTQSSPQPSIQPSSIGSNLAQAAHDIINPGLKTGLIDRYFTPEAIAKRKLEHEQVKATLDAKTVKQVVPYMRQLDAFIATAPKALQPILRVFAITGEVGLGAFGASESDKLYAAATRLRTQGLRNKK